MAGANHLRSGGMIQKYEGQDAQQLLSESMMGQTDCDQETEEDEAVGSQAQTLNHTVSSKVANSIDNIHKEHLERTGSNVKKHAMAGSPGRKFTQTILQYK